MALALLLAALVLVGGGAPRLVAASPLPSPPDTIRLEGTPVVVGSAPMNVRVVFEATGGEGTYRLVGPLADEVGRLTGFIVTVDGERAEAPPPEGRALHVVRYKVASPWGTPLSIGEVMAVEGGAVTLGLAEGGLVHVLLPERAVSVGQKVWVQPADPDAPEPHRILRYGVLRP